MAYANALADWGDHGGYDAEVHWDECLTRPSGSTLDEVADAAAAHVLRRRAEAHRARGPAARRRRHPPARRARQLPRRPGASAGWSGELRASRKTVLYVSHDRELLAATATKIVTVEAEGAWTHGGGFAGYAEARQARLEKLSQATARWYDDERKRLAGPRRRDAPAGEDRPTSSPPS